MITTPDRKTNTRALHLTVLSALLVLPKCAPPAPEIEDASPTTKSEDLTVEAPEELDTAEALLADMTQFDAFPVPKPPFSWGVYPCSTCHSVLPDNVVKRKLTKEHTYIHLNHGPRDKWCFECHDQYNRDRLKLSNGNVISFNESYKLCGQCHGTKYRDWRAGVHGKRTGYWNGTKQYLLCANCHDPHSPRFKPIAPKPPPVIRTSH